MMRIIFVLGLLLLLALGVSAQETTVNLVPFENSLFGLQGMVPEGWTELGPGAYARAASNADLARVIIQSAALPPDALLSALAKQIGIDSDSGLGHPGQHSGFHLGYLSCRDRDTGHPGGGDTGPDQRSR